MPRILALVVAAASLSACVAPPAVTDFNGASVKITQPLGLPAPAAPSIAEADRICAKAGKRAEFASSRISAPNVTEYLFLCL